jgi:hypothetical protein
MKDKPGKPTPPHKLDALRQALETRDKPSEKFMRAFETLMRKDERDKK